MNAPMQFDQFSRNGREILRLRPAWFSFWGSGIAVVGIFIFWLAKKEIFDGLAQGIGIPAELSALGLIIGLAPIVFSVLYKRYTRSFEIEDRRILRLTAGFISREKREFSLTDKIQADMTQTIPARLLNFGTIKFWTGDDRSQLIWENAPDPDKIISYINVLKSPNENDNAASEKFSTRLGDGATPPTLISAKKTKSTHFGDYANKKTASEMVRKRIKTPFGHYIDNGDGTVSHEETGLMWIRAPWGMVWNGENFTGEHIKLKWEEATYLFGRGATVTYQVGKRKAFFDWEKRAASAYSRGYKAGQCHITFAGYQDWRLPTGEDLQYMTASSSLHSLDDPDDPANKNLTHDNELNWTWLGSANKSVVARLFPEFFTLTSHAKICLWSANELGDALAWAYDGTFPVGDHKIKNPMGVMFVRQGNNNDYAGSKIKDEDLNACQDANDTFSSKNG